MSDRQNGVNFSRSGKDDLQSSGHSGQASTSSGRDADVQNVKEAAQQTVQETKAAALETAQQIKGDIQAQASEIAGEATQEASELFSQAKEQATNAFAQQREQAVSGLGSLSEALRSTAQSLKESNHGTQSGIGQFVDDAAERLAQSADFLKDKDASQILHEVQDFARKQPMAFVGAAFGVGIIAARLLKGTGSGSTAIDQAMGSMSEQAVNAIDSVKERVVGTTGASDQGQESGSQSGSDRSPLGHSGFDRMDETASDFELSQSGLTDSASTSGASSGATAGYAPEVDSAYGSGGQS